MVFQGPTGLTLFVRTSMSACRSAEALGSLLQVLPRPPPQVAKLSHEAC